MPRSLHWVTTQLWSLQGSSEDLHMLFLHHQELSDYYSAGIKALAVLGKVQTDLALSSFGT